MNLPKLISPSAERNKLLISQKLAEYLPKHGTVLEIASGTGQHIVQFARSFPHLVWQPSEYDGEKRKSILYYRNEASVSNVLEPLKLNVLENKWHSMKFNFIVNINMIHISPEETTSALFEGASKVLNNQERLFIYGPFFEENVQTAATNLSFHQSLKEMNEDYGIRQREEVEAVAKRFGFERIARIEMPANNLSLVFEQQVDDN